MLLDDLTAPVNPLLIALLRSRLHGLASKGLMLVSWTGLKSGRRYCTPVGYQRDGSAVTVLISKPWAKTWWKNFREPWPAQLTIRGRVREATGEWVDPGSEAFFEAVETTLHRLPWIGGQFGVKVERGATLSEEQRGVLVEGCGVVCFELVG